MASPGSWALFIALCIWTCSISTSEAAAAGASDAVFDSNGGRDAARDAAADFIEPTVGPGEAPGRRRRADARRRTHTPKKSRQEKANEEKIAQQKATETLKVAKQEAVEEARRKEAVVSAEKKVLYDRARARIEATVEQVNRMHQKARDDLDAAKIEMQKRVEMEADNRESRENEKIVVRKTKILRSVLEEAEDNVNDALKFCQAVKNGEGMTPYRKSFLAKEHREQGLGGPGGLARLSEGQLSIPWLTNLNDALSKAKLDT